MHSIESDYHPAPTTSRTTQSGFTPHRSTIDRIATLTRVCTQTRVQKTVLSWHVDSTLSTDSSCGCFSVRFTTLYHELHYYP